MPKITPRFAFIADSLLEERKYFTALEYCKRGTADYPDYPTGFILLGRIYLALNDVVAAKYTLQQAVARFPEDSSLADLLIHAESLSGIDAPTDGINEIVDDVDNIYSDQTLDNELLDATLPPSPDALLPDEEILEPTMLTPADTESNENDFFTEIDSIFLPEETVVENNIAIYNNPDFSDEELTTENIFLSEDSSNTEVQLDDIFASQDDVEPHWQIIKDDIGSIIADAIQEHKEAHQNTSDIDLADSSELSYSIPPIQELIESADIEQSEQQQYQEQDETIAESVLAPTFSEELLISDSVEDISDLELLSALQDEYTAVQETEFDSLEMDEVGTEKLFIHNSDSDQLVSMYHDEDTLTLEQFQEDDMVLLSALQDEYTAVQETEFDSLEMDEVGTEKLFIHNSDSDQLVSMYHDEDTLTLEQLQEDDMVLLSALQDEYTAVQETEFDSLEMDEVGTEKLFIHNSNSDQLVSMYHDDDDLTLEQLQEDDMVLLSALQDEYTAVQETEFDSLEMDEVGTEKLFISNSNSDQLVSLNHDDDDLTLEQLQEDDMVLLSALQDEYTAVQETEFDSLEMDEVGTEKLFISNSETDQLVSMYHDDDDLTLEQLQEDDMVLLSALQDEYTAIQEAQMVELQLDELTTEMQLHSTDPDTKEEVSQYLNAMATETNMEYRTSLSEINIQESFNQHDTATYQTSSQDEVLISFLNEDEDTSQEATIGKSVEVQKLERKNDIQIEQNKIDSEESTILIQQELSKDTTFTSLMLIEHEEPTIHDDGSEILAMLGNLYAESTEMEDIREFIPESPETNALDIAEDVEEENTFIDDSLLSPTPTPLAIIPGQKRRPTAFVSTDVHLIPGLLGLGNQIHVPSADIAAEFMLPQWAELPEFEGWVSPIKEGAFVMPVPSATQVQSADDSALDYMIRAIEEATEHRPVPPRAPEHPAYDFAGILDSDENIPQLSSPTLAAIYAKQKAYAQAARMYTQLAHQYPDKQQEYLDLANEMRELDKGA